jgi:hypothetical protein
VDHPKANANNAAVMPLLTWKKENALIVSHVVSDHNNKSLFPVLKCWFSYLPL